MAPAKLIVFAWIVLAGYYAMSGALIAHIVGSVAAFLFLAICLPLNPTSFDSDLARNIILMAVPLRYLEFWPVVSCTVWISGSLQPLIAPDMAREVGVYAATRVLARIPELVLPPIGAVLFPLVSRSLAQNDLGHVASHQGRNACSLAGFAAHFHSRRHRCGANPAVTFPFRATMASGPHALVFGYLPLDC